MTEPDEDDGPRFGPMHVAYTVRVMRKRKDGSEVEGYMVDAKDCHYLNWLCKAERFCSKSEALETAARRGCKVVGVVPIVALEELLK